MFFDQSQFDIRCEWGENGVMGLAASSDVIVIVDVLSFSTSVAIATERGAVVFPYGGLLEDLQPYAGEKGAISAGLQRYRSGFTLSPSSLLKIPVRTRIVLPSPNGSTLTALAMELSPTGHILAGCLRNAGAVAATAANLGRLVAVIPAGERWPGERALRPSVEDLVGAGAIIDRLPGNRSPEAQVAVAAFQGVRSNLADFLSGCSSGRELIERDFSVDVDLAARLDVSDCSARLVNGGYIGVAS